MSHRSSWSRAVRALANVYLAWGVAAGCAADATLVAPQEIGLVGTWQLVRTCGGVEGRCVQAAAPGAGFSGVWLDAAGYTTFVSNGVPGLRRRYFVAREATVYSAAPQAVIHFDRRDSPDLAVVTRLTADSLSLADNAYDGFGSDYVRAR